MGFVRAKNKDEAYKKALKDIDWEVQTDHGDIIESFEPDKLTKEDIDLEEDVD